MKAPAASVDRTSRVNAGIDRANAGGVASASENSTIKKDRKRMICWRTGCCARAVSGDIAAPPSSVMRSRRFMCGWAPPGKRKCSVPHRSRLQSCVDGDEGGIVIELKLDCAAGAPSCVFLRHFVASHAKEYDRKKASRDPILRVAIC